MVMHEHTPSRYKSRFVTFLHLLISPRRVFTYYMDGADICDICGAYITVPYLYYSPITSFLYALIGFVLAFFVALRISFMPILASLLGTLLFHHIYSAVVFAFAHWDAYDPEVRSSTSCAAEAKRGLIKKAGWLMFGFFLPVRFFIKVYLLQ